MHNNFLDDGRYTDVVSSTQTAHASLFSLVCLILYKYDYI
jgi:hypothetical protein